jgi:hypothetical protein
MTPKYVTFAAGLQEVLNKHSRNSIKSAIGDSISNNRTVTVSQLIRFLHTRRTPALKSLGNQLEIMYDLLFINLGEYRNNFRTDAFDINEFLSVYEDLVLEGTTTTKRLVSRSLPLVA